MELFKKPREQQLTMSEYFSKMNRDHKQEEVEKLKKKYCKKTELNIVKLSVLGKGTCVGEDDCFRDRAIRQKLARSGDDQETRLHPKLLGRSYSCKVVTSHVRAYELKT